MLLLIQVYIIKFLTQKARSITETAEAHEKNTHITKEKRKYIIINRIYEGWNFNSSSYLFTTDTK